MTVILDLPYPPRVLNPNVRSHWRPKAEAVRIYRQNIGWLAKGKKPVMAFKVVFCPPNNNRRDIDNAIASFKSGLDGLADAWGVDDSQFLITFAREFGPVQKGGRVLVYEMEV